MIFLRTFAFLFVVLGFLQPAFADRRLALVIGNSGYLNVPSLPNPGNDANDMSAKLAALGFTVTKGVDLNYQDMRKTIRSFVTALKDTDIALFFYAGHGLQVNGKNYLAPIDAQLLHEEDIQFELVQVDLILAAMERNSKTSLVFLDACRNNPLTGNLVRSMGASRSADVGRGLAQIGSGVGTLISFATQPGNVALDGTGRNSPFTAALVQHLGTPGEGITRNLIRVRNDVLRATAGKQVPWDNSSLTGEVILKPLPVSTTTSVDGSTTPTASSSQQAELVYWNSIREAQDAAFFEAYLARYPEGRFADLARLKLASLNSEKTAGRDTAQAPQSPTGFDRSKLARLDPKAAGSALPDRPRTRLPQDLEEQLALAPDDYKRIQIALNALGYDVGAPDGAFGPKSRTALRKYQVRNRLEESGYLTEGTLLALLKTFETTPNDYDGRWLLQFHRWHYGSPDRSGVNLRSLLARAEVTVRNGEIFILDGRVFSSDKPMFDTFKGRLSDAGQLSLSMTIDSLFGNEPKPQQEVDVTVNAKLPTLVPFERALTLRGSRLWVNPRKGENVWLKLEMRRMK